MKLTIGLSIALCGFVAGFHAAPSLIHPLAPETPQIEPQEPTRLMRVTAYCPCEKCCGQWADGFTANGHRIRPGDRFVAAPPEFAFGTLLTIPGYGTVPVKDRGGAIKGDRLGVFFPTHQDALNWGVQWLSIAVNP